MSRILFRTLAVALILSLASAVISAEEMWTSVVSLYIYDGERPVFADHFFEVLDQGEYILLPLTQLANYLELNLEYSSLENVISVSSDRGSVRISLKDNLYLDHPEWSTYEPTTFEDVFFVAPQVFEYVAGVSIEWQPLFQTVVVTLEELPNWLKSSQTDEQKAAKTDEEFILAKSKVRNGLTLFRYQFSSLFEYPAKKHTLSADWEVFGKVGPFSIHAIVDTDLINYAQHSSELKFIRAKHEAGNHLLVLGDHEAVWEASLGKVVVRGLYFQYARGNTTTNIAYKDFSGEVIPGSTVTLYVNNQLVASLSMGETVSGTYEFLRVPLRPNQLNYVRIVITKPTGEFEERHYQVADEMSSVSVDMPLMIYGSVDGFVFIDFNKNGIFDRDDIPLDFAQVLLNGSKNTLTNGSGRFIFDHIPLGTATLSVDPESLPPNTKAEEVQIVLDEHRNDVYDLYIPVYVVENSSNNATNYLTNHKTTESEMN